MIWRPAPGFKRPNMLSVRVGADAHASMAGTAARPTIKCKKMQTPGAGVTPAARRAGDYFRLFAATKRVGHPVMWSQAMFRNILPPFARRQIIAALRMERIVDAIVALRSLSSHNEQGLTLAVVDEAMADAGAGGKGGKLTGTHRVNIAVDPRVNLTLENVDEFLFFLFGMRP